MKYKKLFIFYLLNQSIFSNNNYFIQTDPFTMEEDRFYSVKQIRLY